MGTKLLPIAFPLFCFPRCGLFRRNRARLRGWPIFALNNAVVEVRYRPTRISRAPPDGFLTLAQSARLIVRGSKIHRARESALVRPQPSPPATLRDSQLPTHNSQLITKTSIPFSNSNSKLQLFTLSVAVVGIPTSLSRLRLAVSAANRSPPSRSAPPRQPSRPSRAVSYSLPGSVASPRNLTAAIIILIPCTSSRNCCANR